MHIVVQWLLGCGSRATQLLICRFLLKIVQVQARVSDSIHLTINNFLYPRLEGTIFSWALSSVAVYDKVSEVFLIFLGQRDEKKRKVYFSSKFSVVCLAKFHHYFLTRPCKNRVQSNPLQWQGPAKTWPWRTRESKETRDPDSSWHCLQLKTFCCNSMLVIFCINHIYNTTWLFNSDSSFSNYCFCIYSCWTFIFFNYRI